MKPSEINKSSASFVFILSVLEYLVMIMIHYA